MASFIWTETQINVLISEMSVRPLFFDTTCKDYSNRDARRAACDDIARILGTSGMQRAFSIYIKLKLKHL